MKSLYESILDDEDVLIDNAKQDIKKLDKEVSESLVELEKLLNITNSDL